MGKIVAADIMSLDGFYEGPDPEGVMALPMDDSFDAVRGYGHGYKVTRRGS